LQQPAACARFALVDTEKNMLVKIPHGKPPVNSIGRNYISPYPPAAENQHRREDYSEEFVREIN